MPGEPVASGKPFLNIIDGSWRQTVDKDTPYAKKREWEKDGKGGTKWELIWSNWTGYVQDITFKQGDYGLMCHIELEDAVLSLNTEYRYFNNMAGKLCNADLTKPITFHPYNFESDGRVYKGISVQQDGEKLKDKFYDSKPAEFPVWDDEKHKAKKSYAKLYFAELSECLIEELKKLKIPKKREVTALSPNEIADFVSDMPSDLPWEEIKPDDSLLK